MTSTAPRTRRTKRCVAATLIAALSATLAACGQSPLGSGYSEANPLVIRYADYTSATSAGPFRAFAKEVTERSSGRITFKEYWGGSLLGTADMPQGVRGGVADMGMFTATYYGSEYPLTNWLSTLGNTSGKEFPQGIMQGNAAQASFAMNSPEINKQFEDRGMKLLYSAYPITNYSIICTSPVTNLAEAEGKRVRSGGAVWDRELRAAGMVPVNVAITETYEGLQRGVVDCATASPKTVTAYGLWDVAKYHTSLPLSGLNGQYAVMNLHQWNSLTPEDQGIVWDAGFTWWLEYMKYEGLGLETKLRVEGAQDKGVQFLEADEGLLGAIEAYQEGVLDRLPQSAPASLADPQGMIDSYLANMTEWGERVHAMNVGTEESPDPTEFATTVKTDVWDRSRP